ncbi:MAG: peptide-methionine (S)-S-oxide reductase MsrA [Actinomycetota bacterium]
METATLAAGCFWGIEAEYRKIDGVTDTKVGYTGGYVPNPTYELVCSHTTGHAEAVRVEFDPSVVSYEELLELFWSMHDPTSLNRQGPDVGDQYRSAIFFHNEDQRIAALRSKVEAQARYPREIVTQIVPAPEFYLAEEYHQRYEEKAGRAVCNVVLRQKVEGDSDASRSGQPPARPKTVHSA